MGKKNYSPERLKQIRQQRKADGLALKSGFNNFADTGRDGSVENGAAGVELQKFHTKFGGRADPTWMTKEEGGVVYYKARPQNPDRVADTGGKWFAAPAHVQQGYQKIRAFQQEHPNTTFADFAQYQGLQHRVGGSGGKARGWQQGSDGIWFNTSGNQTRYTPEGQAISDDGTVHGGGIGTTGWWNGGPGIGAATWGNLGKDGGGAAAPGTPGMVTAGSPMNGGAPPGGPMPNILGDYIPKSLGGGGGMASTPSPTGSPVQSLAQSLARKNIDAQMGASPAAAGTPGAAAATGGASAAGYQLPPLALPPVPGQASAGAPRSEPGALREMMQSRMADGGKGNLNTGMGVGPTGQPTGQPAGAAGPMDTTTSNGSTANQNYTQNNSSFQNFGTSAFNNQSSFKNSPFITQEYKGLADLMKGITTRRLQGGGLPEGYEQGGLIDINRAYRGVNKALGNKLAGSGLSTSPAGAGITASTELARGGSISDFLRQLPLMSRQLQNEDLDRAASLVGGVGRGESGVGSQSGTGSTSQYGSQQDVGSSVGNSIYSNITTTPYHPPIIPQQPKQGGGLLGLLGSLAGSFIPGLGGLLGMFGGNKQQQPFYSAPMM